MMRGIGWSPVINKHSMSLVEPPEGFSWRIHPGETWLQEAGGDPADDVGEPTGHVPGGAGRTFTNTGAGRPTVGTLNGVKCLEGDGTKKLDIDVVQNLPGDFTIVFAFSIGELESNQYFLGTGSQNSVRQNIRAAASEQLRLRWNNGTSITKTWIAVGGTVDTPYVLGLTYESSSKTLEVIVNNQLESSSAVSGTPDSLDIDEVMDAVGKLGAAVVYSACYAHGSSEFGQITSWVNTTQGGVY